MANSEKKIAKIDVVIGGIEAANNALEGMKKKSKELKQEMASLAEEMKNSIEDPAKYDAAKKAFTEIERQVKSLDKSIKDTKSAIFPIEELMKNLSGQTVRTLNTMRKSLGNSLLGLNPEKDKDLSTLKTIQERIRMITDEIARRKGTLVEFKDIMGQIGTTSDKSLSMAKQRLQELIYATDKSSQELAIYQQQLKQVTDEENRRATKGAAITISNVNQGNFTGTIAETKEAIKLIEQYKQGLKVSDVSGIKNADDAIETLNASLKKTTENIMTYDDAMRAAQKVGQGTFTGTYEDLEKVRKALELYKKQLSVADTKKLEAVNIALRNINNTTDKAKSAMIDIDYVIKHIKSAPLEDLERAATQLQKQLNEAQRGTREFITTAARLKSVQSEIKNTSRLWEEHENVIVRTAKRLASYVLVYAGFNEAISLIKQFTQANLDLSDSLSAIQKTTGLSRQQIAELGREIDKIDTRSTQTQLYELAATAGQLGLSTEQDVLGFVRASNQLVTTLNELGSDAAGSLIKINTLMGETTKLGVERALLATGSAINELSASSAAAAGPIVDVINRLGGIGAQASLSTADLAALGATTDALAQSAEVSGTALNKFISILLSKTGTVANAVGLDKEYLKGLIEQGNTMEAMIVVFEKMSKMGGLSAMAPIMKDLGSEGARMAQVFATLAGNVDFLREQVQISRSAFQEATSVTKEYNTVNENAAGIVARIGNNIKEYFVNSQLVEWIRQVLVFIMQLPQWLDKNVFAINSMTASITTLTLTLSANYLKVLLAAQGIKTLKDVMLALQLSGLLVKDTFVNLFKVLGKHPLIIIATAAAAVAGAIYKVATASTEAEKAQQKLNAAYKDFTAEYLKEYRALNDVFFALQRAGEGTNERRKMIALINKQYGKYLSNMLTEKSSADEIRKAYDLINASLREQVALKIRNQQTDSIATEGVKKQADALDKLREGLTKFSPNTGLIDETINKIVTDVTSAQRNGVSNITTLYDIQRDLLNNIAKGKGALGEDFAEALDEYIRSVYRTERQIYETKKRFEPLITGLLDDIKTNNTNDSSITITEAPEKSTENKDLTDQRKAIKAKLADFEAIYKDFQRQITEQYNQGGLTETSFNNQMLANDLAYYQDRQDVLQDFLDGRNKIISRSGKDISRITDETVRSDLFKNISEDAAKSEEALKKMADSVDKSMLSVMDKVAKVRQEWANKLEKSGSLGMIGDEGISKAEQNNRMRAIESFYSQLNTLTDEELRKKLSIDQLYGEEAANLTGTQLDQLRTQYQNYYDNINKLAIAEADKEWKRPGGRKEQYDNAERAQGQNVKLQSSLKAIGLGTDSMEEDSELALLRLKLQAAQEYYDLVESKGAESLAARESIAEAQAALDEKELEITQRKLQTMKQYTDAVVTFGEQMGEAAFSEVADRKEAAKQLLQTTMKLTKDLMMQEIQRMIFKKSIKGQEVALEQGVSDTILKTEGARMMGSITATGAQAEIETTAGIATGSAKTIGELGWWGIPLIAVISAVLSALLGSVMGGLSKSKSEVAAATGATSGRRMATGMLTYAEGDYPVLGNDGKMYNATYQKELKTGIYSGGAHFGIFSEKKPEMIVDGETTRKLVVDYPHIYDAITTIAQHGRLRNAMPTFAAGDYPAAIKELSNIDAEVENEESGMSGYIQQMQNTLAQTNEVNKQLLSAIKKGIVANINPYTNYDAQKKADKFIKKRGIG